MASETPLLAGVGPTSASSLSKARGILPENFSSCILAEGASKAKSLEYKRTQRKLMLAVLIAFCFMVVEVVGGLYAHSLAIITDAAHLLSDVSGFAVSAFAAFYAARRSKEHFSYGYHRIEVLGALASILSVWLVTGVLVFEAVNRVIHPEPVNGKIMFILAMTGVVVNVVLVAVLGGHHHLHDHDHDHDHDEDHGYNRSHSFSQENGVSRAPLLDTVPESPMRESLESPVTPDVLILDAALVRGRGGNRAGKQEGDDDVEEGHGHCHDDHGHNDTSGSHDKRNINLRGAVVHVLGDLVQSLGVAIAGALIWYHQDDPRWYLADPICTFFFAILVMWTTRAILRDISDVLMERVPRGLCIKTIYDDLSRIHGVQEVHDLHVWSLTPGIPLLCAHVSMSPEAEPSEVLHAITSYCRAMGIEHSTVQLV